MVGQFLLYNKVNQLYIYIYPHISSLLAPPSLPPSLSHPSSWSQSTELISLCYATALHQLSILHLVVYICPCHSLTLSHLTLPPPRVLKSILQQVCVFIPVRMYFCRQQISTVYSKQPGILMCLLASLRDLQPWFCPCGFRAHGMPFKSAEGGILLHVLLFSAQTRSPSSFHRDICLLTSRCTENMHSTLPVCRLEESVSRSLSILFHTTLPQPRQCPEFCLLHRRDAYLQRLTCFPAGLLLFASPNLTDRQVGEDTHRECIDCSSFSKRLREIHVKQAYVILWWGERRLHNLGVCVYDLGREKRRGQNLLRDRWGEK